MTTSPAHRIEYVDVDQVVSATRNPKGHDLAGIRASIGRFGFVAASVLDERTGKLVAGHGRVEALRAMRDAGEAAPAGIKLSDLGGWQVPMVRGWASRSDAEAEAYIVADNEWTVRGGWQTGDLAQMLSDLATTDADLLAVTGFSEGDLADLLRLSAPPDLDALAQNIGEPKADDGWPVVRLKVPPPVADAWRQHLEANDGKEVVAFARLLGAQDQL